jgi:acetyl esterase/lipase
VNPILSIVKMKFWKNWLKVSTLKIAYASTIILNTASILLGVFYILTANYSIFWDVFGIILLITLFGNLILVFSNSIRNKRRKKVSSKMNLFSYIYLVIIIFSMICLMLGNLLVSVNYSNRLIDNAGGYTLIYLFYFGNLIVGIIYASYGFKNYKVLDFRFEDTKYNKKYSRRFINTKRRLKKVITIISRTIFIIGIVFGLVMVVGSFEFVTTFIAIVSGQFGIFFSIIFFANTILLLKLKYTKWSTKKFYRTAVSGILVSGMLLSPLFIIRLTINDIESNFSAMLGSDWKEKIPEDVEQYFLETPFSLSSYFLGVSPKDCKIEKDILFYNDEGIRLYFDAYMPSDTEKSLPGANSTIIRIHGGSWVSGDKGLMNMMQMNKYFAAQGYVVFDIQYGLDENPLYALDPLTPAYQKGNFNIDDMVRHIGEFTKFLAEHANEYCANINSVFISGGSAGGHLTCATALGIASGDYTDLFSPNLIIKGMVPFYPANDLMNFFGITGSDEFRNPEKLIRSDSPPCLIFQGTHDIINYFGICKEIQDMYYSKGNGNCAILWMPFGGHASDFYFTGYYNQIFLYYMERFMYLNH